MCTKSNGVNHMRERLHLLSVSHQLHAVQDTCTTTQPANASFVPEGTTSLNRHSLPASSVPLELQQHLKAPRTKPGVKVRISFGTAQRVGYSEFAFSSLGCFLIGFCLTSSHHTIGREVVNFYFKWTRG